MGLSRRDFLKGLAVGGTTGYLTMAGVSSTVMKDVFLPAEAVGDFDIGECKSVTSSHIGNKMVQQQSACWRLQKARPFS
jgi:hypothetical protein